MEEILLNKAFEELLKMFSSGITAIIKTKKWERFFVNTGKFLTADENNRDRLDDELSTAFSKENLKKMAKKISKGTGSEIKTIFEQEMDRIFSDFEIDKEEKKLFVDNFFSTLIGFVEKNDPIKYIEFELHELKEQITFDFDIVNKTINSIDLKIAELLDKDFKTISEINFELRKKSKYRKMTLDNFVIDDTNFLNAFEKLIDNRENIHVVSKSKEETLYLILNQLSKYSLSSKVLVIYSKRKWEKFFDESLRGYVLIPFFDSDEIYAIEGNVNIFIYDEDEKCATRDKLFLRRRLRNNIIESLISCGHSLEDANTTFNNTSGLFFPMKKHIFSMKSSSKYGILKDSHKLDLAVALVINSWGNNEGDKELIEELCNKKYDEFIEIIEEYTRGDNPIFIKRNRNTNQFHYSLASFYDAWEELSYFLNDKLWLNILGKIPFIFESIDLQFEGDFENEFTDLKSKNSKYSIFLKKGILKSLIMKKNFFENEDFKIVRYIDDITKKIYESIINKNQFADFSLYVTIICELNPELFLQFMKESLKNKDFIEMCSIKSDALFGKHYYTHYLFAIEKMLFLKEMQIDALKILFEWDAITEIEYSISNKPKEELNKFFCAWVDIYPLFDKKSFLAKVMIEQYSNAWDILANNLPHSNESIITNACKPEYISFEEIECKQSEEYLENFTTYFNLCLENVKSIDQIILLIKKMRYYSLDIQNKTVEKAYVFLEKIEDLDKVKFKDSIREIIYRNRFHKSAGWALNEEKLKIYLDMYNSIRVKDELLENKYLFDTFDEFPIIYPISYEDENWIDKNKNKRKEIIQEFFLKINNNEDLKNMIDFCDQKESTIGWYVAQYYNHGVFDESTVSLLLSCSSRVHIKMYSKYLFSNNFSNYSMLIDYLIKENVSVDLILDILENRFLSYEMYCLINKMPDEIKKKYWKFSLYIESNMEKENMISILDAILEYGDFVSMVYSLNYVRSKLSPKEIVDYIINSYQKFDFERVAEIDSFCLESVLEICQKYVINNMIIDKMILIGQIEMVYYRIIRFENMKCYEKLNQLSPDLYAELLSYTFKKEKEEKQPEERKKYVDNLFGLFLQTKFCPAEINGTVDYEQLKQWIDRFENLLKKNNQKYLFSSMLGELLAYSPVGDDGFYPCEAVRRIIEEKYNRDLQSGYIICEKNKRGVYTPNAGVSEQNLSIKYKENADFLRTAYPKTAKIYDAISRDYEYDAKNERAIAEE